MYMLGQYLDQDITGSVQIVSNSSFICSPTIRQDGV
jgi:hypothetical protein